MIETIESSGTCVVFPQQSYDSVLDNFQDEPLVVGCLSYVASQRRISILHISREPRLVKSGMDEWISSRVNPSLKPEADLGDKAV